MLEKMTARERVLCSVEGGIPDRVPMDFGANPATLKRLYQYYGVKNHSSLLKTLHVDIFDMRGIADPMYRGPVPNGAIDETGVKENFWGVRSRIMETATGPEECFCDFKLKGVGTIEELSRYPWPSVDWFDFSGMREALAPWKDFAIMAAHGSFFQMPTYLKSLEDFLVDLSINREAAEFVMDRYMNFYLEFYERLFISAPGCISIIRLAEDIGMQDRPMISQELFGELLVPRIRKFAALAHHYDAKLMFHSCGSIRPFIPGLIEAGVDILDPIQPGARDMDPAEIKKDFGARICLHGSIDTQYTLPKGSWEDVADEVTERVRDLGRGGRFILAPCHVLQTDVPMENIEALYATGYRMGFYN